MAHLVCTSESNWLACIPQNLDYTGKQGRPLEPLELALWARWPVPRNLGKYSKEHQFWASQVGSEVQPV